MTVGLMVGNDQHPVLRGMIGEEDSYHILCAREILLEQLSKLCFARADWLRLLLLTCHARLLHPTDVGLLYSAPAPAATHHYASAAAKRAEVEEVVGKPVG